MRRAILFVLGNSVLLIGAFYLYNACAPLAKSKNQIGPSFSVVGQFAVRVEDNLKTKESKTYGTLTTEDGKLYTFTLPDSGFLTVAPNSKATATLFKTDKGLASSEIKSEIKPDIQTKLQDPVFGAKKLLVVLVDFNDAYVMDDLKKGYPPFSTINEFEAAVFNSHPERDGEPYYTQRSFADQVRIASRGRVTFTGEVYRDSIRIDVNSNNLCTDSDPDEWIVKVENELKRRGLVLDQYTHTTYVFPKNDRCKWAGLAMTVPGKRSLLNGIYQSVLLSHEIGHSLGLWHACTQYPYQEYGDDTDFMGQNDSGVLLNLLHREQLGWINRNQIKEFKMTDFNVPKLFEIGAHDLDDPNAILGINIPTGANDTASISFRGNFRSADTSYNQSATFGKAGAHIHYAQPQAYNNNIRANTRFETGLSDGRETLIKGSGEFAYNILRVRQISHTPENVKIEISPFTPPTEPPKIELYLTNRLNGFDWSHLLEWHVTGSDKVDLNVDNVNGSYFSSNGRLADIDPTKYSEIVATSTNFAGTTTKKIVLGNITAPPKFQLSFAKNVTTAKPEWCPTSSEWCRVTVDGQIYKEDGKPASNQSITGCVRYDGGKYTDAGCAKMVTDSTGKVFDIDGKIWSHDLCVGEKQWYPAVYLGHESVSERNTFLEYYPTNTKCF